MKISKSFILLFSLCLIGQNARAFDLSGGLNKISNAYDGAKKAIEKEKERQEKIRQAEEQRIRDEEEKKNPKVKDSRLVIKESFQTDTKWALIKIEKENFKEEVLISVSNGSLSRPVYLKNGPGKYVLTVFSSANSERYSSNYLYAFGLNVTNQDPRDMSFLLPSESVQSDDPRIVNQAHELTGNIQNHHDKVKEVHDYVARLIDYNWEGYNDGSYVNDDTDALSVLKRPKTVCAGYSNLFAALLRASGIRTSVVFGTALGPKGPEKHAWNEVLIDGEWKIVDVTWDDTESLRYDYFFPRQEDFARDHTKEEITLY